ncbi:hypothetical protein AB1282_19750 [Gottfriedia sp. S16(2024)]|uniref:hypothetical protein n=1 Tax=Gottfriedia sp. S16(2024) TaxID=3162883 RepID=UPI003D216417
MENNWKFLSNSDKDLLIAKEVLVFKCFQKEGGFNWYNEQYSLGHWRYSTNLEDALDMYNRLIGDGEVHIVMGKDFFACDEISNGIEKKPVNFRSTTLPDLLCKIAIYLKK